MGTLLMTRSARLFTRVLQSPLRAVTEDARCVYTGSRPRWYSSQMSSTEKAAVHSHPNEILDYNNVTQTQGGGTMPSVELIHHLERTSLVDFENAEALERLTEAISFANQLFEVNTEGVEPLITVLEDESLYLREDKPEPTSRKDVLMNASITEEDYFVAPPGNIPLEPSSKQFLNKKTP